MNIRKLKNHLATAAAAALMTLMAVPPANAVEWAITDTPLFLMAGVKPNLIMAIDDSGSMDGEMLLRANDGAAWWRAAVSGTCTGNGNSFTGCDRNATGTADVPGTGVLNFNFAGNADGTWKKYIYLFPNGSGTTTEDRRRYTDSTNDHFAVAPLPEYAWSRGPETNGAYFDPSEIYTPWPDSETFDFEPANIFATEYDPVFNGAGTIDLTRDYAGSGSVNISSACTTAALGAVNANYGFRVYTGMTLPPLTCFRSSSPARNWEIVRSNGTCRVGVTNGCNVGTVAAPVNFTLATGSNIGIRYFPATFFLSAATPLPADFGYNGLTTPTGLSPNGTVLNRYEIKPDNFVDTAHYDAAIQNFANWFMYYRKRHLALRAGLGSAFLTLEGTRVAGFTINSASGATSPDVTMLDIDDEDSRETLYTNFYQNWTGNGGTPNRAAVANLIRNYKRTGAGAPITNSCQRNFGMLFTDGFSNPPAAGDGINGIAGNADGNDGEPYADNVTDTLADAAMSAYENSLRPAPGMAQGRVKPQKGCEVADHDPSLDCQTNPHMNFYAVTLGARGIQFNPDADPPVDPYEDQPTWPTSFSARHPSAVDDLWHATINGRGKLLNASKSSELARKLGEVLNSLVDDKGTASSAAFNSGSINSTTRLFQASFDAADWSGNLTARKVSTADAALGEVVDATLPAADDREIITVNSTGSAVAFLWDSLDDARKAELQPEDELGSNRLSWLRGSDADEAPSGNNFRPRTKLLGDIMNSAPVFVGAPAFRYPDSLETPTYSSFRAANIAREHMVYVGANDGMLHAFSTDDAQADGQGDVEERMAFIPGAVFKNLHNLTSPTYNHQFFVDGSPVAGDAFFGGAWHTMLVAGLNKGGQGIYALDVTDPDNLTEAQAASVFKWEFDDADDADLGLTYSRPSIVRTNNDVWAAGFGNGYNNTVNDDRDLDGDAAADVTTSATGNAVLYIVDIEDGSLIKKIDTGVGTEDDPGDQDRPNGLSTPVFVDVNGDSNVDVAYAGDLFGNLWKFDLSSEDPDGWVVANGGPLFVATDEDGLSQPITVRPNVSRGARGVGLIVMFGTGKYLELTDVDTEIERPQSFYALMDPNTGASTDQIGGRDDLLEQSILFEVKAAVGDTLTNRRVTTNLVPESDDRGWFIDLVSPLGYEGEVQVSDPLIRDGHVIFTTLVPTGDPCENGGSSWLWEINLFTGARLPNTPWDLNNNGDFTDDKIIIGGVEYPVSAIRNSEGGGGIAPKPAAIAGDDCDYLIYPDTSGGITTRCRNPGPRGFGRQSWRQAQ
ncbi:MAG TPA: PilC/PilY family type IV pilus protein [Steroidobacteraceae bacterium]|nr:PilC/PilY family type IV pilus protein [Steroidobacteraceae bacterium]